MRALRLSRHARSAPAELLSRRKTRAAVRLAWNLGLLQAQITEAKLADAYPTRDPHQELFQIGSFDPHSSRCMQWPDCR